MSKALEDIRVLSNTVGFAGPFCGQYLADLGAEVIRVTGVPYGGSDYIERYLTQDDPLFSMQYFDRNKKCIELNLKMPKGVEIFKKLAKISDVVLENFRPGQ
jgi:crotonobetainyl-CoA:carnitine CoA-transferase CaiB-like acyl-CoA transferase